MKIGPINDKHIGQALTYQGSLLTCDDPTARAMLIGNRVAPSVRKVLDHYGIAWKEITVSSVREHLTMKKDKELLQLVEEESYEPSFKKNRPEIKRNITLKRVEMPTDYVCDKCRFSIKKLEEMAEQTGTGEKFRTAGGRNEMSIREVNKEKGYIIFRRSTGKLTDELKLDRLADIHDMIHEGQIDNDYKQIDEIYHFWGNYISGILKHLGCLGKRS